MIKERNCQCGILYSYDTERPKTMCPSCLAQFNRQADKYLAMKQSIRDKSFEEQREAINNFRAGL
jgi:hypothetical protein